MGIRIRAAGHCVPAEVVTNDDLARQVDTSHEWIATRTGIHRRRRCTAETQTDLCISAARQALERGRIDPQQIGVCIVATMTPHTLMPSTACTVQNALGLPLDTVCFDLNGACTGFVMALHTAECLLSASQRKFALVIGGEALSRIVDWSDRSSCILFGDGAGAVVVESREDWPSIGAVLGCHGNDRLLRAPGPGEEGYLTMEGTKVFKFAVEAIPWCMERVLEKHGLSFEDIDQLVLHQANERIIDAVLRRCPIPAEKCHKNLKEYGNTSAASIPMVLSELEQQGKLSSGSRVLLVGFGGGLTWGGALIEYA